MSRPPLRLRVAAAVPALALALAACGTAGAGNAPADTLRIVGPFEVHSLEPIADGYVFTRLQVTETLVTADVEGELAPALATAWTASRDHTRWEFDLVDDATFHDGSAITPRAVVASLEKAVAEAASPLHGVPIRQIRPTDSGVVFDLERPYHQLPAMLTHYSAAILAPASYDDDGHVSEVIGSGPYELTKVELPSLVETTRFDGWRGEAPAVEHVTFQSVGRAESRAVMATSGQADVVFGLEPAGRQRVDATGGATMESTLQPRTIVMKVNAGHPALRDVRVRRALSLALDRASMADAVLRERELAATQLLPPSLTAWHPELDPLAYDQEQARSLLAEAGWRTGADGTVEKAGRPLTLTLLTYPDRPELPALATAIQAALAEIGVDVKVDVTNSSEIPAGQADGSLDLALIAKHFALVSDPLVDVADVFATDGSDWGVMNWHDDDVEAAIDGLLEDPTDEQAQRRRTTIVTTVQEQLPLIPVAWYRMNAAVNDRVEGFVMDPLETSWRITDLTLDQ